MVSKQLNSCNSLLHNPARTEQRLTDALRAVSEFKDYRRLLENLQTLDTKARASCPELAAAVADRAFDAEIGGRVLIKHALDSMNDLRDGGELYKLLDKTGQQLSKTSRSDLINLLEQKGKQAREKFGDAAGDMFAEAVVAVKTLDIEFFSKDGRLAVSRKNVSGESNIVEIATTRQAGQMGRVSSDEFFCGRDGRVFVSPNQLFLPNDCHHRPTIVKGKFRFPVDIYAGTIGGLAMTKSLLYQHARRMSELGPRGLRGEDPVTAILIAIAVIGTALVIYGIATGDEFITVFGAILIVGAALVAFGGYTLILGVVV